MKKTLSLILALMLMLSFCTAAFAAEAPSAEYEAARSGYLVLRRNGS